VVAYYAADADRAMLERLVASAAGEPVAVRLESVGSADWVARSQSLRGPVCAGRFLVHGSHDRGRIARNRFTVEIDAASAFGTAHHASTRGCLLALDRVLKTARPRSVLDIGTGTGILAIAAAKTMRVDALASDNDPVAARIAADNAKKNGVAGSVRVVEAEGLSHPALRSARPDLLLANLLLNPLLALAPQFARALRGGGMCVLCGRHPRPGAGARGPLPLLGLQAEIANPPRRMGDSAAAAWQHTKSVGLLIDRKGARPYKAEPCSKVSRRR
jgi:ribosomal protein L11 methyltransferase